MGKIESTRTSIFSYIKNDIICPLCGYKFSKKTSFLDLNFHLNYCGAEKIFHIKTNMALNKILEKKEDTNEYNKWKSESKKIKKNISENDSDMINDLQLVIDYNEEEDIYEEHLKKERKYSDAQEKYVELRKFLSRKKSLMDFSMIIECKSFSQMFKSLKEINIYYNIIYVYNKKNNEKKNYSLNFVINKYIREMIKLNIFEEINNENILSFSFNNTKVDFEMIGVILSILIIYPEIKIRHKIPLILFKLLINQKISLNDVKYSNKNLYGDLSKLTVNKDISQLNLFYTYDGNELILGGAHIKINSFNVFDYVEKVVNYEMNKYKKQINIIKNVINQFIPKKYLFSFNAEQLEQIINKNL